MRYKIRVLVLLESTTPCKDGFYVYYLTCKNLQFNNYCIVFCYFSVIGVVKE